MKFTFSWLQDHLDTTASLEDIVEKLSLIGLEVESVTDRGADLAAFKTCRIKQAVQHPNADRLRVCLVETCEGDVQVVCGAPNARTGLVGIFAPAGTWIPGTEVMLKAGEIRGEASNGMLVSEREMGLSDEHDGIIELPADTPLGLPIAEAMGFDDPIIEIGITPNRGDCLGVRGIARDLAAAGLGQLKPLQVKREAGSGPSPVRWAIAEGAAVSCVAGRGFRGVKNGASPRWLQDRLRAVGLRPVSALVDVTNYISLDLGRPLHVFDGDRLRSDCLTWRVATPGESFRALDDRDYTLDDTMTVACDGRGVVGLGGVMGGADSGCQDDTTTAFLEVALFDPVSIAMTGRKTGIHSDARYRFERGVDPDSLSWGLDIATRMILDLCGGEASEVVMAGSPPDHQRSVTLRPARLFELCGVELAATDQTNILRQLGFGVEDKDGLLVVAVPSWRSDVELEACLVEEVLRIHGFDKIPELPLPSPSSLPQVALTREQRRVSTIRTALCWQGLDEAVTFSFVSAAQAAFFGPVPETLAVVNPISADLDTMRPSLLPTLLAAVARNRDRGAANHAIFEVGPQYKGDKATDQQEVAAGLRAGHFVGPHWDQGTRAVDVFDVKADALAALQAVGTPIENLHVFTTAPEYYHPGRSGVLGLGPQNALAFFGELHPRVSGAAGIKGPVLAFEVFFEQVPFPKGKKTTKPALELSAFQAFTRDFAFVVDAQTPAQQLLRALKGADKSLISDVLLFDVYQGDGVAVGKKSLAVTVTIQPYARTLTEDDIAALSQRIIQQAMKSGAVLRH